MADIEDRAKKWADEYLAEQEFPEGYNDLAEALIAAYLAGSAQTQRDYVEYMKSRGWL